MGPWGQIEGLELSPRPAEVGRTCGQWVLQLRAELQRALPTPPIPRVLRAVEGRSGGGSAVPSLPERGRGRWRPVRRTDACILQMCHGRFLWGAWLGLRWGEGAG